MSDDAFRTSAVDCLAAVHRWAFHLCQSPEQADDLVQETYLRAFSAGESFDPSRGGIRPWLFSITYNLFLRQCRQHRRECRALGAVAEQIACRQGIVPVQPDDGDGEARILEAVSRLPESQRSVLTLWAMEGLKYSEIGQVLGLPLGTVMSRLHRARRAVAADLGLPLPSCGAKPRLASLEGDTGAAPALATA